MKIISEPVGILGGTFDPIHHGHLHIAKCVVEQTPIKCIKLLPCYQPVHRPPPIASVEDRVEMIRQAIENVPYLELDTTELERKSPSYMIDTLKILRSHYPNVPFSLILGTDVYQRINTWRDWQKLLDYTHFLVLNRPKSLFFHVDTWLKNHETQEILDLKTQLAGKIYFAHIVESPISSTEIRNQVRGGQVIDEVVPRGVVAYIKQKNLYPS